VLEFFCRGLECDEETAALSPHDYGVAIVLLNVAEQLVPRDQVGSLREAVRRYLLASYLERFDKPAAEREFAALRDVAQALPEPAATLLRYVNERDVAQLGPRLRPYIDVYVNRPSLSPARSPAPSAPVYLLHGQDDDVIPAAESQHLADRLHRQVPVRLLVTQLISHADADRPAHIIDVVELAAFWGDLLDR
jgi:pimeloyl-ACP methyl ester carboxylesterase